MATVAVILDTETTDVSFKDGAVPGLVELGGSVLPPFHRFYDEALNNSMSEIVVKCTRYKPYKQITFGATAVHGIQNSDVADEVDQPTEFRWLNDVHFIIGHNIDFDWMVLGSNPRVKRICTLAMIRKLWPELDSHKLLAFVYFAEPKLASRLFSQAHGTAADVELTRAALRAILFKLSHQENPVNITGWHDLWVFSEECRLPTTISFGKHAGMAIDLLPISYVAWLTTLDDKDTYFFRALLAKRSPLELTALLRSGKMVSTAEEVTTALLSKAQ